MRRLHAMTDLDANAKGGVETGCTSLPSGPTSAGSAAAVLENNCTSIEKLWVTSEYEHVR